MSGKDIGEFLTNRFQSPVHTNHIHHFQIGRGGDETQRGNQVGWREDQTDAGGADSEVVSDGFIWFHMVPDCSRLFQIVPDGFRLNPT